MRRVTPTLFVLCAATASALPAPACNPESAALNILGRQGLNLLRPARSYITPGGLFVKGKGLPVYVDSYNEISPEPGNLIDFDAVILEETKNKSFGVGFAFDLAAKLLAAPLGVTAKQDQSVSIAQVETTGKRLTTPALDKLIAKGTKTSSAARTELQKKNDVYVVQEIYLAKDINLQSTSKQELAVGYNDGKAVNACGAGGGKEDSKQGSKEGSKEGSKDAQKEKSPTTESKSAAAPPASESTKPAAPAAKAAVSLCRDGKFTLKMHTDKVLPFAVRLARVRLQGADLVRDTTSDIKTTLGVQPGELPAARIGESFEITGLQHRQRGTK